MNKRILKISLFVFTVAVVLSGCTQLTDVLNPNFLTDTGLKQGAEQQVTPDRDNLLLIKVTNNTDYKVTFKTIILRQNEGIVDGPSIEMLDAKQSIGELLEQCDTDAVQLVRVKPLAEQNIPDVNTEVQVPEVFIWVNGLPLSPVTFPRPLILNQDYECGDTIEFIVSALPEDRDRFKVSVAIYK